MPSFDVVSEIDLQEVDNALHQARKEIEQRYDFKGTHTSVEKTDDGLVLKANSEGRVQAALDVLQGKLVKRGVSLRSVKPGPVAAAGGGLFRQVLALQQGIPQDKAREIIKFIKDTKMKVQGSIQGDAVRVTGKSRDELQACIQAIRGRAEALGLELQFVNFRD